MQTLTNHHQWIVQVLDIRMMYSLWGFYSPVSSTLAQIFVCLLDYFYVLKSAGKLRTCAAHFRIRYWMCCFSHLVWVHVPVESCNSENSQHWHCRPFVSHLCRYSTRSRLPKSLSQATPLRDSVLSCMLLECQFRVLLRNWTINLCYSVAHTSSDCTSFEPTLNFCNFFLWFCCCLSGLGNNN